MLLIISALLSPFILLFLWIGGRLLYCCFNFFLYKYYLRVLPAVSGDPFARIKALRWDPTTKLWEMNTKLAGKGNAFLPVVFVGPYVDMGRPVIMINSPELIKQLSDDEKFPKLPAFYDPISVVIGLGLVNAKGDAWKIRRDIMSPIFYHTNLKAYGSFMTDRAAQLIETLKDKRGTEVCCISVLSQTTMAILLDSMFANTSLDPLQVAERLRKTSSVGLAFAAFDLLLGSTVNSLFPWQRFLHKAKQEFYVEIFALCDSARKKGCKEEGNLISLLVHQKDDQGNPLFTDAEIVEDMITILIAGYDSTKSAVSWALYYLCTNRHELEALNAEVDRELKGPATVDDIPKLPKCKNAILESIRMRASAPL